VEYWYRTVEVLKTTETFKYFRNFRNFRKIWRIFMNVNEMKTDLTQEIGSMARNWGLSEGGAALYAVLALSGEELTMNDLQNSTGYSLSSVSTHLKALCDKYLVSRTKKDGVYIYKAEVNFEEIFRLLTKELLERNILPLYNKVSAFRDYHNDSLSHHLATLEEEMQKLIDYLTKIVTMKGETHVNQENQIIMSGMP
jgi:DNA-binding transcriptional regulator GbsR (MarR family)